MLHQRLHSKILLARYAGKDIELFRSDSFFRVYSKGGVLLKSSEWLLWKRKYALS